MERLGERALKRAASRPVLWFCLGMLFVLLALVVIGLPLSDYLSRMVSGEITEELISKCGLVSMESEENGGRLTPELFSYAWAGNKTEESVSKGYEIMAPYGYEPLMDETVNPYYKGIRIKITSVLLLFGGGIIFVSFLAGIIIISIVMRQISKLTRSAERLLESKGGSYPDGLEGCIGRHTMLLKEYARRTEKLLHALSEEKNRMKDFLSDVSHQLKTPAAVLKLNHELMLSDSEMKECDRADFLNRDLVQLERLEWLLAGLLKLARMDAGAVEYDVKENSMRSTADLVISSFKQTANKKGVSLKNNVPSDMIFSYDENWMQEALGNLIKNAIEHCKDNGGEIVCGGTVTPITAELTVSDNGAGIPKSVLPHIFDRFYTKSGDVNPSGAGIGLSLSAKIFEAFGGKIKALSEEGGGTEFKISFLTKM